ncbi:hypothetical protein EI427_03285 [Flammeovirga pectinis]|uniref:Lipid A biosynthesis acyltransferase n=1 Tax=Flammeovirga pectinis TaxID=2494373 RepID=A0A3S9NZC0_9BACT|nr:lysophospholipid acyltransferase family protein [Flammeovirga pectinis]AZQ61278.1 hypothetical protein EI427_03285 [Flammeovirga pectinis]
MFFIRFISRLPFPLVYLLSNCIAFVMGSFMRYRRSVIMENLSICFPEKTLLEKYVIQKKFYRNLSDVGLETIKSMTMSVEDMKKRVRIKNLELLKNYIDKKQPLILLTGHICNWEWQLAGIASHLNIPIGAVYKPLASDFSEKMMLEIRARFGGYPVPMANTMREILIRKKKGDMFFFGLVADQSPPGYDKKKEWVNFFGKESAFFAGPEKITEYMNFPVVYSKITRRKRGYYDIEILPVYDGKEYQKGTHQILNKFTSLLEENIKLAPSNWLWSHKRWKYSK